MNTVLSNDMQKLFSLKKMGPVKLFVFAFKKLGLLL
jgi:hypothetical protein